MTQYENGVHLQTVLNTEYWSLFLENYLPVKFCQTNNPPGVHLLLWDYVMIQGVAIFVFMFGQPNQYKATNDRAKKKTTAFFSQ